MSEKKPEKWPLEKVLAEGDFCKVIEVEGIPRGIQTYFPPLNSIDALNSHGSKYCGYIEFHLKQGDKFLSVRGDRFPLSTKSLLETSIKTNTEIRIQGLYNSHFKFFLVKKIEMANISYEEKRS